MIALFFLHPKSMLCSSVHHYYALQVNIMAHADSCLLIVIETLNSAYPNTHQNAFLLQAHTRKMGIDIPRCNFDSASHHHL